MTEEVRTRIAPSPTGDPHVGTGQMALFNRAFAHRRGGKFILRLEDTDQERYNPESIGEIFKALEWLGLMPDEGPEIGGPYAPYVQTQRKEIYKEHAEWLVREGKAYRCFPRRPSRSAITCSTPPGRCTEIRSRPPYLTPWMNSIEPTSRPRVGWAAISRLIGRESSRAATAFCWLPPESAPMGVAAGDKDKANGHYGQI